MSQTRLLLRVNSNLSSGFGSNTFDGVAGGGGGDDFQSSAPGFISQSCFESQPTMPGFDSQPPSFGSQPLSFGSGGGNFGGNGGYELGGGNFGGNGGYELGDNEFGSGASLSPDL
eukprot:943169-Amorphochlora_amoeboformis.AAC.1